MWAMGDGSPPCWIQYVESQPSGKVQAYVERM